MTFFEIKVEPDDTAEKRKALYSLIRLLAAKDDGAISRDYEGFNLDDTDEGQRYAEILDLGGELSEKDFAAAREMIFKYWRQLPRDHFNTVYGPNAYENCEKKCADKHHPAPIRRPVRRRGRFRPLGWDIPDHWDDKDPYL